MSQPKKTVVRESTKELLSLEKRHRGTPIERRVRMLIRLKDDPSVSFSLLARELRIPRSTLKRWWATYRRDGVDTLLHKRAVANAPDVGKQTTMAATEPHSASLLTQPLVGVLNTIPTSNDVSEWIREFKRFLIGMFPEIDRVLLALNIHCDLEHPQDYQPEMFVSELSSNDLSEGGVATTTADPQGHGVRLFRQLSTSGFPWKQYHTPHSFVYNYREVAYLATLFLLRKIENPPISYETLEGIRALEPFLVGVLSDGVARCRPSRDLARAFSRAFEEFSMRHRLTVGQRRVLMNRFTGKDVQGTATEMNISPHTVKSHIRGLQDKVGTGSIAELFVLCYSPLIHQSLKQSAGTNPP